MLRPLDQCLNLLVVFRPGWHTVVGVVFVDYGTSFVVFAGLAVLVAFFPCSQRCLMIPILIMQHSGIELFIGGIQVVVLGYSVTIRGMGAYFSQLVIRGLGLIFSSLIFPRFRVALGESGVFICRECCVGWKRKMYIAALDMRKAGGRYMLFIASLRRR